MKAGYAGVWNEYLRAILDERASNLALRFLELSAVEKLLRNESTLYRSVYSNTTGQFAVMDRDRHFELHTTREGKGSHLIR